MTITIITLILAYVAVAALLLILSLQTRWPAWVKTGCIVLVSGLYFVTYDSLTGMLGWPTEEALPEKFLLHAAITEEPDKETGSKGIIHLWLTEVDEDESMPLELPRAYTLPYDSELHERISESLRRMRQGILQVGESGDPVETDKIPMESAAYSERLQMIKFYNLPDPELPEK